MTNPTTVKCLIFYMFVWGVFCSCCFYYLLSPAVHVLFTFVLQMLLSSEENLWSDSSTSRHPTSLEPLRFMGLVQGPGSHVITVSAVGFKQLTQKYPQCHYGL